MGRTLALWLGGAGALAMLVMLGLSSDLFGRGQPGPDHLQADPDQVAVIDGDTLRLGSQVVRLAGVGRAGAGRRVPGRPGLRRGGDVGARKPGAGPAGAVPADRA